MCLTSSLHAHAFPKMLRVPALDHTASLCARIHPLLFLPTCVPCLLGSRLEPGTNSTDENFCRKLFGFGQKPFTKNTMSCDFSLFRLVGCDLVRLLGMNDRTRSMRMVFWIQRLHRGADLCHTLKTRLKFWQSELFSVCPNKFSRESPNFHKCFFGSKRESQVCATCVYFSTTSVRPTQSMIYVPLLVNRFQNSGLLIVQYKYVKSFSEDFILQNLILCTRSCGTGFITEPN